jgi:peptidoglycan/xylan/chitin deacetylase (PgdA/CDA1 family)
VGLKREIDDNSDLLEKLTGQRPYLIRPPYGAISRGLVEWLAAKNLTVVMWNGGCIDWWLDDIRASIPYLINGMADSGALLCLHDSYASTCNGVGQLIDALAADVPGQFANPQGRRIISMDECLDEPSQASAGAAAD